MPSEKTIKCLMDAFAGESKARNKYSFFASIAEKAGYNQIAGIFRETEANEREHAKRLYKLAGELDGVDTVEALKQAIVGENYEHTSMYPEFMKIAEQEGDADIAKVFKEIGEVEEQHEKRYQKLLDNIKADRVFKRDEKVQWHCRNCGYIHTGKQAPEKCPACDHEQGYFEVWCEAY